MLEEIINNNIHRHFIINETNPIVLEKIIKKFGDNNKISMIGDKKNYLVNKYDIIYTPEKDYTGKTNVGIENFQSIHKCDYYFFCFMLALRFNSDIVILNNIPYFDNELKKRLNTSMEAGHHFVFYNCKSDLNFINKDLLVNLDKFTIEKKIQKF